MCGKVSTADATARVFASVRTHPVPSRLNLHPAASAIATRIRPRSLERKLEEKARVADLDGRDFPQTSLNLHAALPIKWEITQANVNPRVVSLARNFRHNGLPIVHLWESGRNLSALGLNPHGKPALYSRRTWTDELGAPV
jgi:hypothetical protein